MTVELEVSDFGALMRRYSFAYTASHDFAVADSIMVDDYVLRMGTYAIEGRNEQYKPATQKQYRQYPGMGFTVHDFVTDGTRAALCFSEFGRSTLTGVATTWLGISLYRWNGALLTECRVEQDYFSRAAQAASGVSLDVPQPALDPWTTPVTPAQADAVTAVTAWLERGEWMTTSTVILDDEDRGEPHRPLIAGASADILDIFGSGDRVAFHVAVSGTYSGGLGAEHDHLIGTPGTLYATGLVAVGSSTAGDIVTGRMVTDRLSFVRRLEA